ncbi:ABC transporter ATP-binding protein [Propionimicrobium lymphophilum]|uniref:ABC transporter ATP-binding protein n=1 Tax=Propionimicrobium lymphophilum TaxID=33012 RepID=UPI000407B5AB|nr:ABC transporter ATP-binding protein [Propionimicrobium lymphophilum]
MVSKNLLEVRNLRVSFKGKEAVRGIDLEIRPGQRVGLIGESGSGKSVTALALMKLLPPNATIEGSIKLADVELSNRNDAQMSSIRGSKIGMIFQEPMTALDPTMQVGRQVAEALLLHSERQGKSSDRVCQMLEQAGLPDPQRIAKSYPHQLSGGQRQRVLIAMALINAPSLLICDEPTTALDVTVQDKVLKLLDKELAKVNAACLFISHDLAVVSQICEYLMVMYKGEIVESGRRTKILNDPQHPYTKGLLAAANFVSANPGQPLRVLDDFWSGNDL